MKANVITCGVIFRSPQVANGCIAEARGKDSFAPKLAPTCCELHVLTIDRVNADLVRQKPPGEGVVGKNVCQVVPERDNFSAIIAELILADEVLHKAMLVSSEASFRHLGALIEDRKLLRGTKAEV